MIAVACAHGETMNHSDSQIMSIFADALACDSPESRADHLDRVCGDDAVLRAQVEALLNAHDEAGDFLKGRDSPADFASATDERECSKLPARSSGRTSCWSRSAKGAWASSTWPTSRRPFSAASR